MFYVSCIFVISGCFTCPVFECVRSKVKLTWQCISCYSCMSNLLGKKCSYTNVRMFEQHKKNVKKFTKLCGLEKNKMLQYVTYADKKEKWFQDSQEDLFDFAHSKSKNLLKIYKKDELAAWNKLIKSWLILNYVRPKE